MQLLEKNYSKEYFMQTHDVVKSNLFSRLICTLFLICLVVPLLTSCESRKTIVNGLDEREANEILVYLATKGIDAAKVPSKEGAGGGGGSKLVLWDVTVSSDQATEAMSLLNQIGLPRRRAQNLLGIFSGAGLVPSEMEQEIRYQAGLAEQIASTIRKIDGVLDAEVQISFPKEDPLNPDKTKGKITASVYVKHNGVLDDPNSHLITKIKRLVAASVTGLDYDNVTVIGDRARVGELSAIPLQGSLEEEKQYVSVWTVIVAKDSVTRFRVIFFSFTIVILILLLIMIWMGWKFYPVLEKSGGFKELFHIHPIEVDKKITEVEIAKDTDVEKKEASPKEQGLVDKDIDET